jgi:hypothetical protein
MINPGIAHVLGRYIYELALLITRCPAEADAVRAAHSEHFLSELGITINAADILDMAHLMPHVARLHSTGQIEFQKLNKGLAGALVLCSRQSAEIAARTFGSGSADLESSDPQSSVANKQRRVTGAGASRGDDATEESHVRAQREEPEQNPHGDALAAGVDPYAPEVHTKLRPQDCPYQTTVRFLRAHRGDVVGSQRPLPAPGPRDAATELRALLDAVLVGDLDAVKYLLRLGAVVQPVFNDSLQEPPLCAAVRCHSDQQLRIISALVSRRADIDRAFGANWNANKSAAEILNARVGGLAHAIVYNPTAMAREIDPATSRAQ